MSAGGCPDMDRIEIGAYKRSWKAAWIGRSTETAKSSERPASFSPQGGGQRNNERRKHDLKSLAYLRSKTVQTMGVSSEGD